MPEKFLKAVELSLREWGRDRFAMGTFAMDSPKEWYSNGNTRSKVNTRSKTGGKDQAKRNKTHKVGLLAHAQTVTHTQI